MQMLNDNQCHEVTELLSQNPTSDFPKEITCSLRNEKPECPKWLGRHSFEVKFFKRTHILVSDSIKIKPYKCQKMKNWL